jgi:hypothetical protein
MNSSTVITPSLFKSNFCNRKMLNVCYCLDEAVSTVVVMLNQSRTINGKLRWVWKKLV